MENEEEKDRGVMMMKKMQTSRILALEAPFTSSLSLLFPFTQRTSFKFLETVVVN